MTRRAGPPAGRGADDASADRWTRVLRRLLPHGPDGDTVLGDLYEDMQRVRARRGATIARGWYVVVGLWTWFRYVRPAHRFVARTGSDVRLAFRHLRRRPGFTLLLTLTLGLGISAVAALTSVVDAVLLRPLPFEDPERLVRVWAAAERTGEVNLDLTYGDIIAYQGEVPGFDGAAGISLAPRALQDDRGPAENVVVARVTPGFFELLGLPTLVGRAPGPGDDDAVVISEALWRNRYGSDPAILGAGLTLEGSSYTVAGVVPSAFGYPSGARIWRLLTADEREDDDREVHLIARLAPGVTLARAAEQVRTVAARQARNSPETHAGFTAWLQPLHAMLVRDVRMALLALGGAVAALLLITCANAANLLVAQGVERGRDTAVRAALGATRSRIFSLRLTESVLLASLGGAVGVLASRWVLRGMLALAPPLPRQDTIGLDARVLGAMVGLTVVVALLFGCLPALVAARRDGASSLGGRGEGGRGPLPARALSGLVGLEIALCTVLVALGLLLFGTFRTALQHDRGFDPAGLIAFNVDPLSEPQGEEALAYLDEVVRTVASVAGVSGAGLSSHLPTEQRGFRVPVTVEGADRGAGTDPPRATFRIVTHGLFEAAGIRRLSGRGPSLDGEPGGARVDLVVNERFARLLGPPDGSILGRRVELPWLEGTVSGVVADVSPSMDEPAEPIVYAPVEAFPLPGMWLLARSSRPATGVVSEVRDRVRALDPSAPIDRIVAFDQVVAGSVATERFTLWLTGAFALLALTLAGVGVYGVVALSVAARRSEIGVRRALGAGGGRVVWEVGRPVAAVAALGTLVGVGGSVVAGTAVRSMLAGVTPTDWQVLATVVAVMAAVALLAAAAPLARATRIPPAEALQGR